MNYADIQRRQMAAEMLLRGGNGGAIGGLGALVGGFAYRKADKDRIKLEEEERSRRVAMNRAIGEALSSGDYKAAASRMMETGDPEMMDQAFRFMQASIPKPREVSEAMMKAYTPESLQTWQETGRMDVLQPIQSGPKFQSAGRGMIFDPNTGEFRQGPQSASSGSSKKSEADKIAERGAAGKALGLTGDALTVYSLTGQLPSGYGKPVSPKTAAGNDKQAQGRKNIGEAADRALQVLDEGLNTGMLGQGGLQALVPESFKQGVISPQAQVFESAVGELVSALRAAQRVPGSGAESDKELALLLKQAPSLMTDEKAARDILSRLKQKASQHLEGSARVDFKNPYQSAPKSGFEGFSAEEE